MIKVQKNLKCFRSGDGDEHREIGKALIQQANSLIHLKLNYVMEFFLPLNIFSKFNNLQRLELSNFDEDHLLEEQLEFSTFPKLEVLKVGSISLGVAIKIIEKTKGNLLRVQLGCTVYEKEYSGRYLRAIYKNCPKIKILSLGVNEDDFKEFENLLIKCQKIQILIISRFGILAQPEYRRSKPVLKILARSSPKALRDIRFTIYWRTLANDLELFCENWKGRVPISLHFSYFHIISYDELDYFAENCLGILKKYKRDGVIKDYGYTGDDYNDYTYSDDYSFYFEGCCDQMKY